MTTTTTDHPARRTETEQWLDSHHVQWTFHPDLELDRIDTAKSRANQARVDAPIIEEVRDRYTADWARGDTFPAVIAHQPTARSRKVILLGGNHRHEAALANNATTIAAYIVMCDPNLAQVIAYADNAHHGYPPSTKERVRQAVHLIGLGWTAENAAAAVGVSGAAVSIARKATEGARRARDLKIPGYDLIASQATQVSLARIPSDPVFEAAVRYAVDAGLSSTDADKLTKRLKACRSENDALKLIGGEQEERRTAIQQRAGGNAPRALRTSFGTLNNALSNIVDVKPATLVPPTPDAADRMRTRIRTTIAHLEQLAKTLT